MDVVTWGRDCATHHVFAYGSLINAESRRRSLAYRSVHRARLLGYRRGWYTQVQTNGATGLGLVSDADAQCNGVLIELDKRELQNVDARELPYSYERVAIAPASVSTQSKNVDPGVPLWTYLTPNIELPSDECPIIQSYVDVILSGCLAFDREFAREFVQTTSAWDSPWLDDRARPRYPYALDQTELEPVIDSVLCEILPDPFRRRTRVLPKDLP